MSLYDKLLIVQQELKAPKNQFNKFGNYYYRSCEDILEGIKPILNKIKAVVTLTDEVVMIGERYYIKAIATFIDIETGEAHSVCAYAREDVDKKGMDQAQITGSASSYARKYALNGLFSIDDTKDSDATNTHEEKQKAQDKKSTHTQPQQAQQNTNDDVITEAQLKRLYAICKDYERAKSVITKYGYKSSKEIKKSDYDKIIKELEA